MLTAAQVFEGTSGIDVKKVQLHVVLARPHSVADPGRRKSSSLATA